MITFPKPDVEQFLRTFSIGDFIVRPDEKQLVFSTNLSGKYNLWGMDLPNSFPYPLTSIDQSCQDLLYDKQGRFIIAGFDQDGNENTQFYGIPLKGGAMKAIVHHENTRNFMPILSNDSQRLYYTTSRGNPSFLNSYCLDLESGQETQILEGEDAATYIIGFSPDEKTYLYHKHYANTYSLLYAKCGSKDMLLTPPSEKQHTVTHGVFVSDSLVYLLTDYDSDFTYLASFNLETNQFTKIKELESESFTMLKYNEELQLLLVASEKGVVDHLYELDLQNGNWSNIPIPCSVIVKLEVAKSGALYLSGMSATKPHNIYKKTGDEWVSLTKYTVPGVDSNELVEPDIIKYRTFDNLEVESLFFRAKKENDNGEVIFWPHGGPQAAERKFFRASFQFFLNNGYSIFAPNFRGSTGYGLEFMKMVEGDWGNGPRMDNVAGLDWLIEQGYAQKGNILLMGGSFGGYMALLLHGRHADYFKAVVDIFGPSNLFSFINSVPEDWKPVMDQWVGNPEKDREKLIEYSPITYLDSMNKPMLVIQGANDPRVVKEESDQIVKALNEKGRSVEYMLLEDEGHGFSKKENEIAVYQKILSFLNQFTGVTENV
ncbi:S9 family peptidase [Peribacillus muralis]|uniref:S9 family peptidase n=1 Tax=Peribacillus muralis TaxID=264697 RepID=UPI001F4EF632|nr:prolyl oligopeptidase family serine peptidase [Peribacillus muralis]MCK1993496.1 prolyl oligopeptidase family serine peptidase [Peribacillus muralis]MCK2014216.1 prolyl oligopeptidase family serine peptidase [Peribacillus muralis]